MLLQISKAYIRILRPKSLETTTRNNDDNNNNNNNNNKNVSNDDDNNDDDKGDRNALVKIK